MPCIPGDSAAISALTRTRVPTCVKVTLPCACDPLAGRITAVADGPSGGVVAQDARNSAQAASLIALFMLLPLEKASGDRRNARKRCAGRGLGVASTGRAGTGIAA